MKNIIREICVGPNLCLSFEKGFRNMKMRCKRISSANLKSELRIKSIKNKERLTEKSADGNKKAFDKISNFF